MFLITDTRDFSPKPRAPLVVGLGNFDGMHLGHQALLKRVVEKARKTHGKAALFTFREHPQGILHPEKPLELLTGLEQRLSLFEQYGIDLCFLKTFTLRFSTMEAEDFVRKIILQKLGTREICLGTNAHFGHDRKGNASFMRLLAERWGFRFEEIPPVKRGGEFVSSSRIRKLIKGGHLGEAADCLGRPFGIFAAVVPGSGRGKQLGFPTANLDTGNAVLPPCGVYPVSLRRLKIQQEAGRKRGTQEFHASCPGKWLWGILNYGHRPTFRKGTPKPVAEVFIFDFKGDLYGKMLEVVFYPRLREEETFPNREVLKHQITQDILRARDYFRTKKSKR